MPGDPANLPGYDEPGEEWFASGGVEHGFPEAERPLEAPAPIKSFTWFVAGLVGAGIVLLVVAMVSNVLHLFG